MTLVACPSCGEKGNIPGQLVGKKIRCQKCGTSFLAGSSSAEIPVSALHHPVGIEHPKGDTIEVDGLDPSTWSATAIAVEKQAHEHKAIDPAPAFTASPQGSEHSGVAARQYKILTQKDRWFEGKFDLSRLEEALNHYARQGWVVRAMSTPHIAGFSGGPREEIVVLLER